MEIKWIQRIVIAGILTIALTFGGVTASAEGAGTRLTSESDQILPMQIYSSRGLPVKNQPVFRSNGDYEWMWMNRGNATGQRNLLSDGNGTFYYYDFSNIIHAIDPDNEHKWMSAPMKKEIRGVMIAENGNLIIRTTEKTNSTIHVIGEERSSMTDRPNTTDRFIILNRVDGKTLIDVRAFNLDLYLYTDPDQKQIALLTEDGIACYDLEGNKLWSYSDGITFGKDRWQQIITNVSSLGMNADGTVVIRTSEGRLITLLSNGQLKSNVKVVQKTFQFNGHYFSVLQYENGLYRWGGKWLTEDELLVVLEHESNVKYWTPYTVNWSGGSYSTTSEANNLIAKDRDGITLWTYFTPDSQYGHPGDLVCNENGDVYFSDSGGNIYGLDAQGNELFHLLRNNKSITSSELKITPDGGLLGRTNEIGIFRIGKRSIGVTINGESVTFEQQPLLEAGTTMVPF